MHCLRYSSSCAVALPRSSLLPYGASFRTTQGPTRARSVTAAAAAAPSTGAWAAPAPTNVASFVGAAHCPIAVATVAADTLSQINDHSTLNSVHASSTGSSDGSSRINSSRINSTSSSRVRKLRRQPRQRQQSTYAQTRMATRRGSSSSKYSGGRRGRSSNLLQPAVEDAIAAADAAAAVRGHIQQQQQQGLTAGISTSSSDSDGEDLAVLLTSAADKLYQQRLRQLHTLMSPEGLQQLQLTPQQFDSLQVVLSDLQDLQASWEDEEGDEGEGSAAAAAGGAAAGAAAGGGGAGGGAGGGGGGVDDLTEAEAELVQQLSSSNALMPDDFDSYLLAFLPDGCGPEDTQALKRMLNPNVLKDIQSVYADLKQFEQSDMDLTTAQQRYMELSAKITGVTDRVQDILAHYNSCTSGASSSSSSSGDGDVMLQKHAPTQHQPPHDRHTAATTNTNSSSSSSRAGSKGRSWGSAWAKPRTQRSSVQAGASSSSSTQQQHQQQHPTDSGPPQSGTDWQPQAGQHLHHPQQQQQQQQHLHHPQQQQQQQPGSRAAGPPYSGDLGVTEPRVRRRRSVIRRAAITGAAATAAGAV